MYCVIKCIVRGNQARVKNTDLRHPSCALVKTRICVTRPQCVNRFLIVLIVDLHETVRLVRAMNLIFKALSFTVFAL